MCPDDIFTEPEPDPDTLANLGPVAPLAGRWLGEKGVDVHPVADGSKRQAYVETWDFEPIDPALDGPQLFYGLRYHQHVVKPGISSNDLLDRAFRTPTWTITFGIGPGGQWACTQTTRLEVQGREGFDHNDVGILTRVGPPVPNPKAAQGPS